MEDIDQFESSGLKTGRIALLDADYVKYSVTSRIKKEMDEGTAHIYEDIVVTLTKEWLYRWNELIEDPIIFCFSGKSQDTFRYKVGFEKEYKGNRKSREELYEGENVDRYKIVKYIMDNNPSLLFHDLEADDIVSALQDDDNTYIISQDKDLKQVPGMHYHWGDGDLIKRTPESCVLFLARQLLMGDSGDNIPGIYRLGEKKAYKIIDPYIENPKYALYKAFEYYIEHFGRKVSKEEGGGMINGIDAFVESWNLIRLRSNRGSFFKQKYAQMFDLKDSLILRIKEQNKN